MSVKPFLSPVRHKVAFDGREYSWAAQVEGALRVNRLSRREARAVLRGIGYDWEMAAYLVRGYSHDGRDKSQEAQGAAAEITRLEVIE